MSSQGRAALGVNQRQYTLPVFGIDGAGKSTLLLRLKGDLGKAPKTGWGFSTTSIAFKVRRRPRPLRAAIASSVSPASPPALPPVFNGSLPPSAVPITRSRPAFTLCGCGPTASSTSNSSSSSGGRGFSLGFLTHRVVGIKFFDVGGSDKIRGIWRNYLAEAHGCVYVINGSDTQRLNESIQSLVEVYTHRMLDKKPILILVTHTDIAQNLPVVHEHLAMVGLVGVNIRVSACSLQPTLETEADGRGLWADEDMVQEAMDWLLNRIMASQAGLAKRIEMDMAEQQKEWDRLKAEKAERLRERQRQRETGGVVVDSRSMDVRVSDVSGVGVAATVPLPVDPKRPASGGRGNGKVHPM
ncbi:P-loop containing nucleoside triphosphate hydrolase protein [Entophlyctis helioformis]|nr:P-loop containing nucleoside triphosphate hydrolase protein [Entophlyctis helioformis]